MAYGYAVSNLTATFPDLLWGLSQVVSRAVVVVVWSSFLPSTLMIRVQILLATEFFCTVLIKDEKKSEAVAGPFKKVVNNNNIEPCEKEDSVEEMEAELEAGEAAALALLILVLHVGAVVVVGVLIGIVVGRLLVLATHHHGFLWPP